MIIDGPVKMPIPPPPPYSRLPRNARPPLPALPIPAASPTSATSATYPSGPGTSTGTSTSTNPYDAPTPTSLRGPPPPFSLGRHRATINDLPQHVLLQVIYTIVDPQLSDEDYRWGLYWLAVGLRLVSRNWYTACMHVLRSCYLPLYVSLIRAPYSANPYPLSTPSDLLAPSTSDPYPSDPQRETAILDMFIAFRVRQDVLRDESELHLEAGHEGVKDLFELMQPRARTEDLVRKYGLRAGVVSTGSGAHSAGGASAVPFGQLSVSFAGRKVGLVRAVGGRKRTLVEVSRDRNESLESVAKRIAAELAKSMDVLR